MSLNLKFYKNPIVIQGLFQLVSEEKALKAINKLNILATGSTVLEKLN